MEGAVLDWRLYGGAALAAGAVVAAALAMPVRLPEPDAAGDPAAALPEGAREATPEDLSAFLELRRWGAPPQKAEAPEPAGEDPAPALNPVLADMGFVGLIAVQDERAVLLALPEGEIVRVLPGGAVPDGRILVSVTDNALTLSAAGGEEEVLTLFPRLPAERTPVASPAGPREGAAGVGGVAPSAPGVEGAASP